MLTLFFALIILGVIFLFIKNLTWQALPWPQDAVVLPPYQGHRGYWKSGAQENTLASFRAAKNHGFAMFELDVRLSLDGIPVVFHDSDLKRFSDKSMKKVEDCTAHELAKWVQAPTLEEVLQSQEVPCLVNIEVKSKALWEGRLERAVADVVVQQGAQRRVIFSSFNPLSLWRLSRYLPEVPRALLATLEADSENKIYLRKMWFAPYIKIHALHLDYRFVSPEDVAILKMKNRPVALWTINDKELAEEYLKAGALSVITDGFS